MNIKRKNMPRLREKYGVCPAMDIIFFLSG